MDQDFTLSTFIENRWAEALEVLSLQDPTYVNTMVAYAKLFDKGISLPELSQVSKSNVPLSDSWHDLLETTVEIYEELDRLELTVSLIDLESSGRIAGYSIDMWTQNAYNLCEKANALIAHTCKVYSLENKLKDKYRKRVKRSVQDKLGEIRQRQVH